MQPTKRFNVFNLIHKALRGMLYETAIAIQQTDFASYEAVHTVNKLEQLLHTFDAHADHEDDHILVHVERHDAQLVDAFEQDHVVDRRLTESLAAHIMSWRNATDQESRTAAGLCIFYAFNEFIAFNLYHMNREENELLSVLWKHYTDTEILEMQNEIISTIDPEVMQFEAGWMMRMASVPEIAAWLSSVRENAPEEVFTGLMQLAQSQLTEARYDILAAMSTDLLVMA